MKRLLRTATLLALPLALLGCEEDDDTVTGLQDCANLVGNFQATQFGFTGTTNTSLTRDFDAEGTTFTLGLQNNDTFQSTFTQANTTPLTRTGQFTATSNELRLGNRALFTGAQDNVEQRFTCERLANNRFRIESASAMRFDFDRDQMFETGEEAVFRGEFQAL